MRQIFLLILFLGCDMPKKNICSSGTDLEQEAVDYFVNNLLGQEKLFFEGDNLKVLPPAGLMSSSYDNGLFRDNELFYSQTTDFVSDIFMDTLAIDEANENYEMARELSKDHEINSNKERKSTRISNNRFKFMSFKNFERIKLESSLYMKVGTAICGGNKCFVNLKFIEPDQIDLDEDYDFYIVFDSKGNVIEWFGR